MTAHRFPYIPKPGFAGGMPFVNIKLSANDRELPASALVDSGSALNVLPHDIGLELGFVWEKQTFPLDLTGSLKGLKAYAVLVQAEIDPFPATNLAFAWVNKPGPGIPVLLGQVNFFQEFSVHFYGYRQFFDIEPKTR